MRLLSGDIFQLRLELRAKAVKFRKEELRKEELRKEALVVRLRVVRLRVVVVVLKEEALVKVKLRKEELVLLTVIVSPVFTGLMSRVVRSALSTKVSRIAL